MQIGVPNFCKASCLPLHAGVVRDILATVVHLMKFSETRDALLLVSCYGYAGAGMDVQALVCR